MEETIIEQLPEMATQELSIAVNNLSQSDTNAFITANTVECSISEMKRDHIIPVYLKDNEPLISQVDFIEVMGYVVSDAFRQERILTPSVRLSHKIMGRIPEAKKKSAKELYDWEKTLYYERMMFLIEVPSICEDIGGNRVSLTIGGVKAYNQDNLSNRKGTDEHFKVFIGFQNKVCTNLCVWSDGTVLDLRVKSMDQLEAAIRSLIQNYRLEYHLAEMKALTNHALTEQQFALLMGRCRMYQHLSQKLKGDIPPLLYGDTQLGAICRDYYRDNSFCKNASGDINLWKLYNLFTGANKGSYIDAFLERSTNAFGFASALQRALHNGTHNWYLS